MQRILEPEVMDTPEEALEYAEMDNRAPNDAFVERLLSLGARGRMLDLGTGPGHIPLLICERQPDARVVGIDLSREMLAIAERLRAASSHAARLEFRLADAKGLPFADGEFDAVFSNTILHHIPDPVPFFAEAWRVLRGGGEPGGVLRPSGGVLLIRDLFRPADEATLERIVAEHAADGTDHQRAMFHASLHAALTPGELREMARRAGLSDFEVTVDSDRHMSLQCRKP